MSEKNVISRRRFLQLLSITPCFMAAPSLIFASTKETAVSNYYLKHKSNILKDFHATNEGALEYLKEAIGEKKAVNITTSAATHFEKLINDLPDVGGELNPNTKYLIIAAWYTAYYIPARELDYGPEFVGKMIYKLNEYDQASMPKNKAHAIGAEKFTVNYKNRMKKWAKWTQQKEYPANWVAEYVEGNGTDFDYGYNYTECGICKYLHSKKMDELAPFVCLNDFIRSQSENTGLNRSKTLGQGDNCCNFRYKQGRKVTQNWDTEIGLIRQRVADGHVCYIPEQT